MTIHYRDDRITLHHGDCLDVLRSMPDASVDSIVTDPPYGLGFMGKEWDSGKARHLPPSAAAKDSPLARATTGKGPAAVAFDGPAFQQWCELWTAECLRVLKPGGHLLAFGGTRTWHRLACAVEDAGFEVRDSIAWIYGSGFPKSLNVSKALQDRRCQCGAVESEHGEPATEHDVRALPGADVSQAVRVDGGPGSVLLPSVPEQGAPAAGWSELPAAEDGCGESGVEGRRDLQAAEGELCGSALRALPVGVPGDGEGRRLRDGAPSRDGSQAGPVSAPVGSGESHQPRPAGQPTNEPRALPVERGSQAWGGWPVCGRCGKPSIPDGLGTAAKPAFEPVVVARKPLGAGTVAANVLTHGTGALNVDGCRIGLDGEKPPSGSGRSVLRTSMAGGAMHGTGEPIETHTAGRWPANVILDEDMAGVLDEQSGTSTSRAGGRSTRGEASSWDRQDGGMFDNGRDLPRTGHEDAGGASRFFLTVPADDPGHAYYCICGQDADDACPDHGGASRFFYVAKAPKRERPVVDGVAHPTVKPLALMRWLVRLVTPPGGTVLEPFAGSGTTVEACIVEGFQCIAIEKGDEYLPLIVERIQRQDRAKVEAEVVRVVDPARAIAEQVAGQLDIFGEATA